MSIPGSKDWKKLLAEATGRGWQQIRKKRHIVLIWPASGQRVVLPGSSSDNRALQNARSLMKRVERGEVNDSITR
jgi:hypothetical protein